VRHSEIFGIPRKVASFPEIQENAVPFVFGNFMEIQTDIKWIAPPDHCNSTKVCWSHFETISGREITTAAVKAIHS